MSNTWLWPVEGTLITDISAGRGYSSWHKGIDIYTTTIKGKNVLASRAGVVVRVFDGCINEDGFNADRPMECDEKGCAHPTNVYYYNTDGEIIDTKQFCHDGIGNAVFIKHADNLYSQYCHLQSICVNVGDTVARGQTIGTVGSSGESTDPHLHFSLSTGIEWWGRDRFNNDPSEIEYNYKNTPEPEPKEPTTATIDLYLNHTSSDNTLYRNDLEYTIGSTAGLGVDNPSRTGYRFDGWYTARSGGTKVSTFAQIPDGTNALYAQWVETVTVKYMRNVNDDGGPVVCERTYDVGAPLRPLPAESKVGAREGYAFAGWYTARTGGGKYEDYSVARSDRTQIWAHWTPKEYAIFLYPGYGTNAPLN